MDTETHQPFDDLLGQFEKPQINHTHYYYFKHGFSSAECDSIIENFKDKAMTQGKVFGDHNKEGRRTNICWIPNNSTTGWIYERIIGMAVQANKAMFHFDVSNLRDKIQFGMYDESFQGTYQRHIDIGTGSNGQRKISISVQLSDPDSYQGGELIIKDYVAPNNKGDVSIFPSFIEHEVKPVTKGTRYSLVLWLYGPAFK